MAMQKTSVRVTILALLLVAVAAGSFYAGRMTAPKPRELTSITFILNWSVSGEHTGFIAAVEKGFYAEEGLAVTILRGYGSSDTAKRLFAGEGQFGHVDANALIKARAAGMPLKLIAITYALSAVGIFGLPGRGPTTPDEVRGKRIATTTGAEGIQLEIFCALNGIDMKKEVEVITMAPAAKVPAVVAGEVDALSGYVNVEPVQIAYSANVSFAEITKLMYRDHGIDVYGNGLAALDSYIAENPEIVKSFVKATMKGVAWAIQHPEEAADIVSKWYPELEKRSILDIWKQTILCIWNEQTRQTGIGYMTGEKIARNIELTTKIFEITPMPAEDVFTNEFLKDLPQEVKFPGS